jgi:protocatechuate 3,4-dioxygenase beta subunit
MNAEFALYDSGLTYSEAAAGSSSSALYLDVYPADAGTKDAVFRALPQSMGPFLFSSSNVDLGDVDLSRPVVVEGTVAGSRVARSPLTGAQLPSKPIAVDASVYLERLGSIQKYSTRAEAGVFQVSAIPSSSYVLEVVPDDPMLPAFVDTLQIDGNAAPVDLDLGYGLALHGRVTAPNGTGLAGAQVYAVTQTGRATASVETDTNGYYILRVSEGSYTVVCEGRLAPAIDPVLRAEVVDALVPGRRVDFAYLDLTVALASGRVVDTNGQPLASVTVGFHAERLDGYEEVESSATYEVVTGSDGSFTRRMKTGDYRIEFRPSAPTLSPAALDKFTLRQGANEIGNVTLLDDVLVEGYILDAYGDAVSDAQLACFEKGFDARRYTTTTDSSGTYTIRLPATSMECALTPPAVRRDLPLTYRDVMPTSGAALALSFDVGSAISGQVLLDGEPEGGALVEFRDEQGVRYGSAYTSQEGAFEVFVAPKVGAEK